MTSVTSYDFRRNETLDRHQRRALNAAVDSFTRHGSVSISSSLRKACQMSMVNVTEMTWKDITTKLGEKPYMATFSVEPFQGRLFVAMPLAEAIRIIDYRLGGGSLPSFERHSDPTDTDLAILGGVVETLIAELGGALSRQGLVKIFLLSQEASRQYLQIAGQLELFLSIEIEINILEETTIPLYLIFPIVLIRSIIRDLQLGVEDKEDTLKLLDRDVILKTPIDVCLEIPPVPITPEEIAKLSAGDIIPFFYPVSEALDIRAEGVLVGKGKQYAIGSKVVCSVSEEVRDNDD
ncbi:MAG: FliM/FliN family flagellar motor switch protein [Firmicutes bacterium]|jgi:flagellar motor switch protein FliM|nr:FliM/FliN family flagellar motor switch protein [Bacillota bacterium]